MRNLKRVLALAMAMVMILGMMVIGTSAASYTDATSVDAQYTEAVDVLTGMGVFQGTGTGAFAPKAVLTRAEAAALIYRVITGDVTDAQKQNYDYASLKDVKAGDWYTGYVTYANNGGYIKGDENGNFNPNAQVTGVQVMAIMLRAAGYGQNGEYEGAAWMDNILTDAHELGITGSISTATLKAPATRELVAQLIFNALTSVKMVTYTPALGYLPVNFVGTFSTQQTLGEKVFGLTYSYGIVVGNQATGEKATKVQLNKTADGNYTYVYANATSFATTTGLDMYGHAVKVWYDMDSVGAKTVYTIYDKATSTAVTTSYSCKAAYAAGFSVAAADKNSTKIAVATVSEAYGTFDGALSATTYPIYVMISNNSDLTVDAIIAVDAYIDQLQAVNNFLAAPNALFAETGLVEQADVQNFSAASVGATVIMEKVVGTVGDAYWMLDTLNDTTTASVTGYNNLTGDIVLADGTILSKSPLAGTGILTGTTNPTLVKGATYTFQLDNNGCYLYFAQNVTKAHFLATWMYYNYTGDLNDLYNYYVMGVNAAGETVQYEVDYATYTALLDDVYGQKLQGEGTSTKQTAIVDLTLGTKGLYSGDVCNANDGHKIIGNTLTANAPLQVYAGAQVVNYNYLVDDATTFYFVTGNASDLKVEAYAGTTALVGNGTSYTLPANAMISTTEIKTSVIATGNYHVDTVVVYDKYGYNFSGSMMYVEQGDPATGMIDLAGNVEINAWINGEAVKVYVPANKYGGIKGQTTTTGKFFTYDVIGDLYYPTSSGLTENVNYDLTCGVATTGTIATIKVTDGTNYYTVGANTKVVTLPGVTKATGVAVSDYASFANLAEAVMTSLSTVNSISVDVALDGKGNVTTLYIAGITLK